MRFRLATLFVTLLFATVCGGCATSAQKKNPVDREMSRYGPPLCTQQDVSPLSMSIQTCVQNSLPNQQGFGPNTLPDYMQMRNPYVVTVVNTPKGTFSNPLMWNVEISRNGEVVAERKFSAAEAAVQTQPEEGSRVQIRSAIPLGEGGKLEPGTYEFRYSTPQGKELGTTTIEVPAKGETQQNNEQNTDQDNTPQQ